MTTRTARPTISAAHVPAARQMPAGELLAEQRVAQAEHRRRRSGPSSALDRPDEQRREQEEPDHHARQAEDEVAVEAAPPARAPATATTRSIGAEHQQRVDARSAAARRCASFHGTRDVGGCASGVIASSGLTRIAVHAGSKLAASAASIDPTDAEQRSPPQLIDDARGEDVRRTAGSSEDLHPQQPQRHADDHAERREHQPFDDDEPADLPRCMPIARSIASVRCRSATPIDSALKTMNVAASIETVPPR